MSELILAGVAVVNLVLAMAATKFASRQGVDALSGRIATVLLLMLAAASIIGSIKHAGWTMAVSTIMVDVVLIAYIYRLVAHTRRLQEAATAIDEDAAWEREEKQRALYDRCSGMF